MAQRLFETPRGPREGGAFVGWKLIIRRREKK